MFLKFKSTVKILMTKKLLAVDRIEVYKLFKTIHTQKTTGIYKNPQNDN